MATPKGFEDLLSAGDRIIVTVYNGGKTRFHCALHGRLVRVGSAVIRARAKGTTIGRALQALWNQIAGARLVDETPEFEE